MCTLWPSRFLLDFENVNYLVTLFVQLLRPVQDDKKYLKSTHLGGHQRVSPANRSVFLQVGQCVTVFPCQPLLGGSKHHPRPGDQTGAGLPAQLDTVGTWE